MKERSGVKLLVPRSRTDLPGVKSLAKGDTVILLQRVMALAKELKQQVTWRKRLTGGFLITDEAPSHKRQASSNKQLDMKEIIG